MPPQNESTSLWLWHQTGLLITRHLQAFAVLNCTLATLFLGLFSLFLFLYLLLTPLYHVSILYIAWHVYDYRTPARGGRRSEWVRRWAVWRYWRDYFPVSLVKTAELSPDRNYILVYHPHGIFASGVLIGLATEALGVTDKFPGIRMTPAVLEFLLRLPLSREYVLALGKR